MSSSTRRVSLVLTIVFLVTSCTTAPSVKSIAQSALGFAPDNIYFVARSTAPSGEQILLSASSYAGTSYSRERAARVSKQSIGKSRVEVRAPFRTAPDNDPFGFGSSWAKHFASALDSALSGHLAAPEIDLTIYLAPRGTHIDRLHIAKWDPDVARLAFEFWVTEYRNSWDAIVSSTIAHEVYHTVELANLDNHGFRELTRLDAALSETAAEIFGWCVSFETIGRAGVSKRFDIEGRRDGVLTRQEIHFLLQPQFETQSRKLATEWGYALAASIWTSKVSSKTNPVSIVDPEAEALRALCASGVLKEPKAWMPLVRELAAAASDPPPLTLGANAPTLAHP